MKAVIKVQVLHDKGDRHYKEYVFSYESDDWETFGKAIEDARCAVLHSTQFQFEKES